MVWRPRGSPAPGERSHPPAAPLAPRGLLRGRSRSERSLSARNRSGKEHLCPTCNGYADRGASGGRSMAEACQPSRRPVAQAGHGRSSWPASAGMAAASRASTWAAETGRPAGRPPGARPRPSRAPRGPARGWPRPWPGSWPGGPGPGWGRRGWIGQHHQQRPQGHAPAGDRGHPEPQDQRPASGQEQVGHWRPARLQVNGGQGGQPQGEVDGEHDHDHPGQRPAPDGVVHRQLQRPRPRQVEQGLHQDQPRRQRQAAPVGPQEPPQRPGPLRRGHPSLASRALARNPAATMTATRRTPPATRAMASGSGVAGPAVAAVAGPVARPVGAVGVAAEAIVAVRTGAVQVVGAVGAVDSRGSPARRSAPWSSGPLPPVPWWPPPGPGLAWAGAAARGGRGGPRTAAGRGGTATGRSFGWLGVRPRHRGVGGFVTVTPWTSPSS
jgi:hypothetical protein